MIAPAPTMSTCKGCGCPIEVKPTGRRREFCGAMACYLKARKPDAKCKTCGKPFRAARTTGSRGGKVIARVYCSVACKNKGLTVETYRKVCVICGSGFTSDYNATQTCGPKCRHALTKASRPIPPKEQNGVIALMEAMPVDISQLADWFRGITPEQLDRVWVQAVIDQFDTGRMGALANALAVVRGSYRSKLGTMTPADIANAAHQKPKDHDRDFLRRMKRRSKTSPVA